MDIGQNTSFRLHQQKDLSQLSRNSSRDGPPNLAHSLHSSRNRLLHAVVHTYPVNSIFYWISTATNNRSQILVSAFIYKLVFTS